MEFVDKTIEVDADIHEVFTAWTAFEDFPRFMTAVERVDVAPDESTHWVAWVENDVVEWDAGLAEQITDQSVEWRAFDGRETDKITFEKLGEDRTQIHYQVAYDADAWQEKADTTPQWMEKRVDADLQSFKELMESGVQH